jgi:hypothetical protein
VRHCIYFINGSEGPSLILRCLGYCLHINGSLLERSEFAAATQKPVFFCSHSATTVLMDVSYIAYWRHCSLTWWRLFNYTQCDRNIPKPSPTNCLENRQQRNLTKSRSIFRCSYVTERENIWRFRQCACLNDLYWPVPDPEMTEGEDRTDIGDKSSKPNFLCAMPGELIPPEPNVLRVTLCPSTYVAEKTFRNR